MHSPTLRALRPLLLLALAAPGAAYASPVTGPVAAPPQATAAEAPLVGSWEGSSGALRGRRLVLRGDRTCAIDGAEGRWKTYSKNKLRLQLPEGTLRGPFTLSGDRLSVEIDGREARLRRVADTPPVSAQPSHADAMRSIRSIRAGSGPSPPAASPFGAEVAPVETSGWPGTFGGDGFTLVLRDAAPGLEGTLERDGSRWEFRGVVAYGLVSGAIETAAGDVPLALFAVEDGIELRAGMSSVSLQRITAAVAAAPAARSTSTAAALEGLATGPVERYVDPGGRLSFDVRKGWKVPPATGGELAIDLGFERGDRIEAMVMISHGKLTREELGRSPAQIIEESQADLIEGLARQGMKLRPTRRRPEPVRAGSLEGAQQTWSGSLANGDPLDVWVGCVTTGGHHATVACITLSGGDGEYLAGAKRMLASLEYDAPERQPQLERQIAGRRISQSETTESGLFGTIYEYHADGSVMRKMLMSGPAGLGSVGGQSEEWGTWMVAGEILYAEFEDGEEQAPLVVSDGHVTGIRRGGRTVSFQ